VHEQWGKYKLDALLARGGMAEVYRASQVGPSGFERPVCLKMVRPELSGDEEFVAMFRREAQIAAALQHQNIVQVFDFDEHAGRLFLAMEYVEGLDLRDILRQAEDIGLRLPVGFALHVAEGLLAALGRAHAHAVDGEPRPVVHRDVSPHNLLVSKDGFVKLADFGIAKARGSTSATRTGIVKGKLAYLSPEQASGGDVGPPSDLYCAGLVLFEMLTGRRLYAGKNEQEVLALALRPSVPDLPWLSTALNHFLARLLAPSPADRFGSAAEALVAVAALRAEAPFTAPDAGGVVKALLALRAERGSTGMIASASRSSRASKSRPGPPEEVDAARPLADDPTRTSRPDVALRRGPRPAVAVGIGATVLGAGLIAGWLLGAGAGAKDVSAAPAVPTPGPPSAPAVAPPRAMPPVVAVAAEDAGAGAEGAKGAPDAIEPVTAPSGRPVKATGWLQINCRPWAEVALDGKPIGTTPINRLRAAAGPHKVILTNGAAGYREEFAVKVVPGKTARVNGKVPRT
jgi:eukaryotic-like serine/threonine-protein kinase